MKKFYWLILPVMILITVNCFGCISFEGTDYPVGGSVYNDLGAQDYYPEEDSSYVYNYLAPYGNWTELSPYGYVWVPRHLGYRWRPYTDGRWTWTDYGWTWISYEQWGDIPFHYGRWGLDDEIGWFWVPGDVWGPAWVSWRSNDRYMGWAPLPPGIDFSVGMDFNSHSFDSPNHFWIFIDFQHFQDRRLNRYVLPFERNRTIINYTSLRNNIRFHNNRPINQGIDADEVQRITRRKVTKYEIKDSRQPGTTRIVGKNVQIFRPQIRKAETAKPNEYLNREEARQKLAPVKIWEPRMQQPLKREESAAQRRQNDEKKLLQKSQAKEISDMHRKRADEEKRIRDASEKEKVRKNYENRISELKKSHEAEKKDIQVRHSNDSNQIRNQNIKKKKNKKD